MNSTNNTASTSKIYIAIGLAIVALILAVMSSSNTIRNTFSQFSDGDRSRKILSKLFANYNTSQFVIFKIRTESGIDIEIYEKDSATLNEKLKQKFSFVDDKDAYIMVDGNSVSLALSDVDKNGTMDIVAPTVDPYGLSRLNIFKYDESLHQFSQSVATE